LFKEQMTKHIDTIFEEKISWDGTTHLRKNNEIITHPNDIKLELRNYYETLFNEVNNNSNDNNHIQNNIIWQEYYEPITNIDESIYELLLKPATRQEIINNILNAKPDSAPGPSGIGYNILKLLLYVPLFLEHLTQIINNIIIHNSHNELDYRCVTTLLPKIHDWNGELEKLRPITLVQTFRKLATSIISQRLNYIIEKQDVLKGNNFGFRPGNGTFNALHFIRIDVSGPGVVLIVCVRDQRRVTQTFQFYCHCPTHCFRMRQSQTLLCDIGFQIRVYKKA
jgi:hypothetical protein